MKKKIPWKAKTANKAMPRAMPPRRLMVAKRNKNFGKSSWRLRINNAKQDYQKYQRYYNSAKAYPAEKFPNGFTKSHIAEIKSQLEARRQSLTALRNEYYHLKKFGPHLYGNVVTD